MVDNIRTKQFIRRVKSHARSYRERLEIDVEEVKKVYREERRKDLGRYRHGGERFMNYDNLVREINERWLESEHGLCQEIVHSLSNKVNDELLEIIIEVEKEESNRLRHQIQVLRSLLSKRGTENGPRLHKKSSSQVIISQSNRSKRSGRINKPLVRRPI